MRQWKFTFGNVSIFMVKFSRWTLIDINSIEILFFKLLTTITTLRVCNSIVPIHVSNFWKKRIHSWLSGQKSKVRLFSNQFKSEYRLLWNLLKSTTKTPWLHSYEWTTTPNLENLKIKTKWIELIVPFLDTRWG